MNVNPWELHNNAQLSWVEDEGMRKVCRNAEKFFNIFFSFNFLFSLSWSFGLFSQHTNRKTIEQTQEICELNFPYNNVILPSKDSSPHMWVILSKISQLMVNWSSNSRVSGNFSSFNQFNTQLRWCVRQNKASIFLIPCYPNLMVVSAAPIC